MQIQQQQRMEEQLRQPSFPNDARPMRPLGLSAKETRLFSLARAIVGACRPDSLLGGFEGEINAALCERMGLAPEPLRFFLPLEIQRRDLNVAQGNAGGYLTQAPNAGITGALYDRMHVRRLGAQVLDLTTNAVIPRWTTGAGEYWLGSETTAITESTPALGQMALTMKHVGAYTEYSRQLLLQSSPSVDLMVATDHGKKLAAAGDKACLQGTGTAGQPTGISNTAGIGSVTGTSIAWAGIVEFESDVSGANALINDQTFGYVSTPAVRSLLKQRSKETGGGQMIWQGAEMNGYPALATLACPSATMIAGDWSTLVVAEFGILEIAVNPFAMFQTGIIGVRAFYAMDVGLRYPAAFSLAASIT